MTGKIRAIVRRALGRFGYILLHVNYTRFGYSLFTDVKSICRDWDWSIDVVFDVGANVGQFAGEAWRGSRMPKYILLSRSRALSSD
jgi:hypothetical protein